jgi:hypothetical protein
VVVDAPGRVTSPGHGDGHQADGERDKCGRHEEEEEAGRG